MVHEHEQYEALGRFVEAFESMVHEGRSFSAKLPARGDRDHEVFVSVALNHQTLTAKPHFEIGRALVAEFIKQPKLRLDQATQNNFLGIMKHIASEYFRARGR